MHDHFDQYYKGMKVEGGGYNFHYKNGRMYFANGHYVRINNLDVSPKFSSDEAVSAFLKYKGIGEGDIRDNTVRLLIKEIETKNAQDTIRSVNLAYRVFIVSDHPNK